MCDCQQSEGSEMDRYWEARRAQRDRDLEAMMRRVVSQEFDKRVDGVWEVGVPVGMVGVLVAGLWLIVWAASPPSEAPTCPPVVASATKAMP